MLGGVFGGGGGVVGKSKSRVRSAFRAVHNMPNKRARRKKPLTDAYLSDRVIYKSHIRDNRHV